MSEFQTIATVIMALIIGFVFGRSSKRSNDFRNEYITQEEKAMLSPPPKYGREFDHVHEDVLDAVKAGKTIQAIKIYRQLHGASLKEAKEFIDNIKQQFR